MALNEACRQAHQTHVKHVVSVIVKRPVLPLCVVDGRSLLLLLLLLELVEVIMYSAYA